MKVLIVIAILVALGLSYVGYSDCAEAGGHYVRGMAWFECIK